MKSLRFNIESFKNSVLELLNNLDSGFKLGLIGFIVGITSGLAAVSLNAGLKSFSHFFIHQRSELFKFTLPIFGMVATVVFLKYIIKDYGGHGVPDVIHSISLKGGRLNLRSVFSKLIGSLLTISSGGSAGPEAPVIISGAAIGSNFASFFKTDERIKIAATGSGAAAAIATIFNAPITGIIFTMEVIIGEWTPIYLLPVVIASASGTEISRLLRGNQIPFSHRLSDPTIFDITICIGLSIFCAVFSIIFIKMLRNTSEILEKYIKNILIKAIFGGLVVALIIFYLPYVKGEGYEFVQRLITGNFNEGIYILALIVIFKIIATSFTLGAGGAGGVFAPALVIGSTCGYLYYLIIKLIAPELSLSDSSLFTLVGMSGLISGTLHAPLTGIFLIIEITNGYNAILPLLLVSFITPTLVRFFEKHSIYHYELIKKGRLHRPRTDSGILTEIKPIELLEQDQLTIYSNYLLKEIIPLIKKSKRNYYPVIDKDNGDFLGMVYFNDLKDIIFDSEMCNTILVEEVMHTDLTTISLSDSLIEIQKKFELTDNWSLPVVEKGKFKGLISKATMLDIYRKELKVQTER